MNEDGGQQLVIAKDASRNHQSWATFYGQTARVIIGRWAHATPRELFRAIGNMVGEAAKVPGDIFEPIYHKEPIWFVNSVSVRHSPTSRSNLDRRSRDEALFFQGQQMRVCR